MTGYVVEHLSAKYSQSTEKLVYFFCQYDNRASLQVTTVLQSIIRQLLDQDLRNSSHTLRAGSPGIFRDKIGELMRKRSKSAPSITRLLLPQAVDHSSDAVVKNYWFSQYASDFWLSHTTEFSPEQGQLWTIFQILAEERFNALSEPHVPTSLFHLDDQKKVLRDYMFDHQHQALFRQWLVQYWDETDLPSLVVLALERHCFSFVILIPPLAKQPESSWLEAILSLDSEDLSYALRNSGTEWMKELTRRGRSSLLARVVGPNHSDVLEATSNLVQLGVDPYYECTNRQGKATTLFEELIRDSDITLLRDVCEAMLLSNVDFECKIARPGRTPLHVAAYYWQSEAIGVLLDYGAFIHAVDDLGRTALHIAAQGYGHSSNVLESIGKLLQEGASLETKDKYGKVALDYATGDAKYHLLSCTCHRYRSEFEI
jgi:hypothetical protein